MNAYNAYHVVNYHITNRCNYRCTYCFGKFEGQKDPPPETGKIILDCIAAYFRANQISDGRVNFAGGEPTLYPHLDELIDHAHSLGMTASIVTNGSNLTPERIRSWKGKIACIGLSIDSIRTNTNKQIGRCCQGNVKTLEDWSHLASAIRECGISLKVNTVVSKWNVGEDLLPLYGALKPDKIKLFQMHLIHGINDAAKPYEITDEEFQEFCARHRTYSKAPIISEPCGSMENSYLMVNPAGYVQLNNNGTYECFGNCLDTPFSEIMQSVPMNAERFQARYAGGTAE